MSATGLNPTEEPHSSKRVSPERLAEYDRLMQQGGLEAVIEALPIAHQAYASPHRTAKSKRES